jgi:hypothetical protein
LSNYDKQKQSRINIFALGNKVLPYIKDRLNEYFYSGFLEVLAETKDIEMVLDCLKKSLLNPDGSTGSHIINTLRRLIYEIRKINPEDPVLASVCEKLIKYQQGQIADSHLKTELYLPIAMTGTETAKKHIETDQPLENEYNEYQKAIANVDSIKKFLLKPDFMVQDQFGLLDSDSPQTPPP